MSHIDQACKTAEGVSGVKLSFLWHRDPQAFVMRFILPSIAISVMITLLFFDAPLAARLSVGTISVLSILTLRNSIKTGERTDYVWLDKWTLVHLLYLVAVFSCFTTNWDSLLVRFVLKKMHKRGLRFSWFHGKRQMIDKGLAQTLPKAGLRSRSLGATKGGRRSNALDQGEALPEGGSDLGVLDPGEAEQEVDNCAMSGAPSRTAGGPVVLPLDEPGNATPGIPPLSPPEAGQLPMPVPPNHEMVLSEAAIDMLSFAFFGTLYAVLSGIQLSQLDWGQFRTTSTQTFQ